MSRHPNSGGRGSSGHGLTETLLFSMFGASYSPRARAAFFKSRASGTAGNETWRDEARAADGKWTADGAGVVLPRNRGRWIGERGDGVWMPRALKVKAHAPGGVKFQRGFPDFSPHVASIEGEDGTTQTARVHFDFHPKHAQDFAEADREMARRLGWFRRDGQPNAARMERYRAEQKLTWHHSEDCQNMHVILVPHLLHAKVPHQGGFSLCQPKTEEVKGANPT